MKVVVNGKQVDVGEVKVEMDSDKLCRQFNITNTEPTFSFKHGDTVEVFTNNSLLLIKGSIEYINLSDERRVTYVGRNAVKDLVDCDMDETIQITSEQEAKAVLTKVTSKYGIKVIGSAKLNKQTEYTFNIGDNVGDSILKMLNDNGNTVTSNAEGSLVIVNEPETNKDIVIEYGLNVRGRSYTSNQSEVYDKYVVVAQSSYAHKAEEDRKAKPIVDTTTTSPKLDKSKVSKQQVDVQGSYGSGKRVKVIDSSDNLTIQECNELAKKQYFKDRERSIDYSVSLDVVYDFEVNTKYLVKDDTCNVNRELLLKSVTATMNQNTDVLEVKFTSKEDGDDV